MADWKPSASLDTLRLRARVLADIRAFFASRGVLEVETPLLCPTTVTDLHIDSIRVDGEQLDGSTPRYLQTSPEFAMKKLLAAGSPSIYQLCKAFRREPQGSRHNPEFTLLEWYRLGYDDRQLMDEVAELTGQLTNRPVPERLSYRALFQQHLGLDPHQASVEALTEAARSHIEFDPAGYQRDDLLQLLLARVIEPRMQSDCLVYDFPASMAALARIGIDESGIEVARRFELFMAGMEIANGYWELTDAKEQRARFDAERIRRRKLGREEPPLDEDLLAALETGLPECAGVALGLDRLLMVVSGARNISEVIPWR